MCMYRKCFVGCGWRTSTGILSVSHAEMIPFFLGGHEIIEWIQRLKKTHWNLLLYVEFRKLTPLNAVGDLLLATYDDKPVTIFSIETASVIKKFNLQFLNFYVQNWKQNFTDNFIWVGSEKYFDNCYLTTRDSLDNLLSLFHYKNTEKSAYCTCFRWQKLILKQNCIKNVAKTYNIKV